MAPIVSIIVTCFNQADYLKKSVKSVLVQTFSDLECIIVDDGSTDNTAEIVTLLVDSDPRVKYFFKQNGGVSSARNFGFEQAAGQWIQFLDGDDWIDADKTRFQLDRAGALNANSTNANPAERVIYSDYERVFIDQNHEIVKRELNVVGALTNQQLVERLLLPDFLANSPFPLLQQCLLMHRKVCEQKRFDETMRALEDRDFVLDRLMAGVEFIYAPIVGSFYVKHSFGLTSNWQKLKASYIYYYQIVCQKYPQLKQFCQRGLGFLLDEAIREKEAIHFQKLLPLMEFPVYLLDRKLKLDQLILLRLFYWFRLVSPSFLLYEKYRGPRSKKLLAQLTKVFGAKPVSKDSE